MTLTKRIIPCLDVKNGRVVKGLNFESIKDAGDPIQLAKKYSTANTNKVKIKLGMSNLCREDLGSCINTPTEHTKYFSGPPNF